MTQEKTSPNDVSETDPIRRAGIEVTLLTATKAEARMPVASNRQSAGVLHGGASAFLAETIASLAADEYARNTMGGMHALGVELNISHYDGASNGYVTATAQALRLSGKSACYEIKIRQGDRLISAARLTCVLKAF